MRLQNEKNSHIKGRDSMRNCIWLIRKSMKVCPQRLPAMLLVALLDLQICSAGIVSERRVKADGNRGFNLSGNTLHS